MPENRSQIFLFLFTILCLTYIFGSAEKGSAQNSVISGEVRASDTGKPIPNVNVFLSRTNLGSATDREGKYRIENVPEGIYELVFSYVGFKTRTITLNLLEPDNYTYHVNLDPVSIQLNELNVVGERDRDWERNLEVFEREFLGTTANAEDTEIRNPEVLHFEWKHSGTILAARAEKELQIVNRSLGYEIYVVLDRFEYIARDPSRNLNDVIEYLIYPRYEELNASDPSLEKRWKEHRKETYLGSFRHFLHSLYNDRLWEESFRIENGNIDRLDPSTEQRILRYQPLQDNVKKRLKGYRINPISSRTPLTVVYENRRTSHLFGTENNIFFVNEFGKLLDALSLVVGGAWQRNRLADELPLNYRLNSLN